MADRYRRLLSQQGFTLVELVIAVVIIAILAAVGVINSVSPSELSLPSQAEKMASDIRYAQALAHTTGKRMALTITPGTNGSYTGASCVASGSCGQTIFSAQLEKNVVLGLGGSPATIEFDTLGAPSATASYTLTYNGASKTVTVAALTGFVTVTSP